MFGFSMWCLLCKFCKKEFNKRSLERHEDQCKGQNNIFEVLCDETCEIDDDENMEICTETHKQSTNTKVDKIDHKCDICEKTCASGFSLKRHINNVHGEKFLMCINHFNSFNIYRVDQKKCSTLCKMSSCICRLIPLLSDKVEHFFWSTL